MSKNIAHPTPTALLDTAAKFFRVMVKTGVPLTAFDQPLQNLQARRNLAVYLRMGCPKVREDGAIVAMELGSGYDRARRILGQDFITPEEIAAARGLVYADEQLVDFADKLPSEEILQWCQANGIMLIAGPPIPSSLLGIRGLRSEYFYTKSGGWYAEERQRFSREDYAATSWLALRKGSFPGSTSKRWDEQVALLSGVEYVPNVAEVAWGVATYKAVRDVFLLPNIYVRTSSLDADGVRVTFGNFVAGGVGVSRYWVNNRNDNLGLASARKL